MADILIWASRDQLMTAFGLNPDHGREKAVDDDRPRRKCPRSGQNRQAGNLHGAAHVVGPMKSSDVDSGDDQVRQIQGQPDEHDEPELAVSYSGVPPLLLQRGIDHEVSHQSQSDVDGDIGPKEGKIRAARGTEKQPGEQPEKSQPAENIEHRHARPSA